MTIRPKVRNTVLVAALATVGATAWATTDAMSNAAYTPGSPASETQPIAASNDAVATATGSIPVSDTLSPNEGVVPTEALAPASVAQPPVTVQEQRLTQDQRIQSQVMDKLSANQRLNGKIGVESNNAVVRLSGWTRTAGQAYRAGRDAGSVMGVKYVQNEIRPRIGGSI